MRNPLRLAVPFFTTAAIFSQSALPKFEVVSVAVTSPDSKQRGAGLFTYPGGRVRANNCRVDYLIEQAFDLQRFQVSGGPRWLREDRFDIEGKPPADSKSSHSNPNNSKLPPNNEQREMLQSVLADRFQLQYHWETKDGPIYSLIKNGKDLKLEPSKDKDEYPWAGAVNGGPQFGDGIQGMNISMPQLAARLSGAIGRIVVDQTGIEGSYDFKFAYTRPDPDGEPDIVSTIMGSVQGLGLKLQAGTGPIRTLVIDGIEKPTAN